MWSAVAMRWLLAGTLALAGAGWLLGSESGLRAVVQAAQWLSAGRLTVQNPRGTLLGKWRADLVRWVEPAATVPPRATRAASAPEPAQAHNTPPALLVQARDLQWHWTPFALLHGRLQIDRLTLTQWHVESAASNTPPTLPTDLRLPLAVQVAAMQIDHISTGPLATPQTLASGVQARFDSDGRQHQLQLQALQLGAVHAQGQARLTGVAPFALGAELALAGQAGPQAFQAQMRASGTLAAVTLDGDVTPASSATLPPHAAPPSNGALASNGTLPNSTSGVSAAPSAAPRAAPTTKPNANGPRGSVHLRLEPFAPLPITALRAELSAIDPARWWPGLPQALLDVDARLTRPVALNLLDAPAAPAGHVVLRNHHSGPYNSGRLPLSAAEAQLSWHQASLRIDAFNLHLPATARLHGAGRWADGTLNLDLQAEQLDARALDTRAPSTRLSGPLRLRWAAGSPWIDATLQEAPARRLHVRGGLVDQQVLLEALELADGDTRASAQGSLALAGTRALALRGELQQFDPGRYYAPLGRGQLRLNARFEASGTLGPNTDTAAALPATRQPAHTTQTPAGAAAAGPLAGAVLNLSFELARSQLGRQPLDGQGQLQWQAGTVPRAQVNLRAGPNRVELAGAWGQPGDTLQLNLDTPDLSSLGWPALSGRAQADLRFSGSLETPRLSGQARADGLRLGPWLQAGQASLTASTNEADRSASAQLRCTACTNTSLSGPAPDWHLAFQGTPAAHRLTLHATQAERLAVQAELQGGWANSQWQGQLTQLSAGPPTPAATSPTAAAPAGKAWLQLEAPLTLRASATEVHSGAARWQGTLGDVRLEPAEWRAGQWRSAGQIVRLEPQPLLALAPDAAALWAALAPRDGTSALVLTGAWQLAGDSERLNGNARLERLAGDLAPDGTPLGLRTLRADVVADAGQWRLQAQADGQRLGRMQLQLDTRAAPTRPLPDAQSLLQGAANAELPDLAWIGPLLGPDWRLGGQLAAQARFSGSVAQPWLDGSLRGSALQVRALDLGLHLNNGQAQMDLSPERLHLRSLTFDSMWSPPPAALRALEGTTLQTVLRSPGRIQAEGELRLLPTPPPGAATAATTAPITALTTASAAAAPASAPANADLARLTLRADRVGVLQRDDRWASLSGEATLRLQARTVAVSGQLALDAGFLALAERGRPTLSDDVVVLRGPAATTNAPASTGPRLRLDATVDLGEHFQFSGAGIRTRLAGALSLRANEGERTPRVTGTIRAVDGRVDAYGQRLDIERGLINFQGPADNPGLNVRAVRPKLPVEAGLEITGTVQRPLIRLVSNPPMPEAEKLSWLVLGHAPTEGNRGDSELLLAAAGSLFGNQPDSPLRSLRSSLGIDEGGLSSGRLDGTSTMPRSSVVTMQGLAGDDTSTGQIVTLGKRLSDRLVLSYEKALSSSAHVGKLTLELSQRVSLVLRAGSDSAIDLTWRRAFGSTTAPTAPTAPTVLGTPPAAR